MSAAPAMRPVDLWYADLSRPEWQSRSCLSTLSGSERARAACFRFAVHRDRFRAARAVLRALVATYVNHDPACLQFETNAYGKPRLAGPHGNALQFNVSHCDDVGVFALTRDGAVGVDVERIRIAPELEGIAARFFTPAEAAAIARAPAAARVATFFRCWTRKEAIVKACGLGLSMPLDHFDVQVASSGPMAVQTEDESALRHWTVIDVTAVPEHACAVAIAGESCAVTVRQWCGDDDQRRR